MILLLLIVIICLPMIGFFLYSHFKWLGAIFISSPLVVIVFFVGWWVVATNHYFVSSTNLENESIAKFSLQETVPKDRLSSYEKREGADGYSYHDGDLFLSTDRDHKIVSLSAGAPPLETSSELKVGDTIERAKEIYGDYFYSYREMGLGKAIVYVDRSNQYLLTIWTRDDKFVANIWLSVY
ncbi:hypothetical protein N0O92_23105 [Alkalihalobacillus sp. MEB130]|uniref:hypothetical protein n=1 Tax=Alkalihalobacillus sp. MEB130 TaxID=2976704 RepID=UPI0028DDCB27|nr:hypothetical protein [Alkalihalobacillus sp. MEB130]MDT8863044.1 hypothetical protein [Alkalihalobacillus sp. MEB130]